MTGKKEPLLSITDLHVSYGAIRAIRGSTLMSSRAR